MPLGGHNVLEKEENVAVSGINIARYVKLLNIVTMLILICHISCSVSKNTLQSANDNLCQDIVPPFT
jgi:hypothetical protein